MRTLTDLVSEASVMLGDSTNGIWTAAELQRYTKDGFRKLMRASKALWDQAYINDRANQSDYPLPANLFEIDRATWDARPLEILSEGTVQLRDDQYLNDTEPGDRPVAVFISGIDTLRLYPPPNTDATTAQPDAPTTAAVSNTRLEFYSYGASLDDAPFDVPDYMARTVRHYVLWKAYKRKGQGHSKKFANHYQQRWEIDLNEYVKLVREVGSVRTGVFGKHRKPFTRGPAAPRLPWQYGRTTRG